MPSGVRVLSGTASVLARLPLKSKKGGDVKTVHHVTQVTLQSLDTEPVKQLDLSPASVFTMTKPVQQPCLLLATVSSQ